MHTSRRLVPKIIVVALAAGLLALAATLLTPSAAPAQPIISWTPDKVVETVGQGAQKTKTVAFTSTRNLTNVAVWIVPELQPYVSATPSSFSSISAGAPMVITLTFSAATSTPLQTLDGTLHLRDSGGSKNTYAKPLQVTLEIRHSLTEKGLVLNYPSRWQLNTGPLALGGPISLNNFAGGYGQGGVIPVGGATVDVTTVTLPSSPINEVVAKDLQGATIESTSTILIGGEIGTKTIYTVMFTTSFTEKNVAVYVPHSALLYKFFLSYRADDPLETQFLTDFQQILDSIQFVP